MQNQLVRLFGSRSKLVPGDELTAAELKKTLKAVVGELKEYVFANVDTDESHMIQIALTVQKAEEVLKEEDFVVGYIEAITHLALLLLGEYPNHHSRKSGRKTEDFYKLDYLRTLHWVQTPDQRLRTLLKVGDQGIPTLSASPRDVLRSFRDQYGHKPTYADFLRWYRREFPADYAAVFR
jgi:hypothetical protein